MVKRSKVKYTRSRDVVAQKISNISHKRHPILEMHLSYRKSRLPEQMAGSDFLPEAPKLNLAKDEVDCF